MQSELEEVLDALVAFRPESLTDQEQSYLMGWMRGYFENVKFDGEAFNRGMSDGIHTNRSVNEY